MSINIYSKSYFLTDLFRLKVLSHLSRCPTVRDRRDMWDSTGSSAGLGYM